MKKLLIAVPVCLWFLTSMAQLAPTTYSKGWINGSTNAARGRQILGIGEASTNPIAKPFANPFQILMFNGVSWMSTNSAHSLSNASPNLATNATSATDGMALVKRGNNLSLETVSGGNSSNSIANADGSGTNTFLKDPTLSGNITVESTETNVSFSNPLGGQIALSNSPNGTATLLADGRFQATFEGNGRGLTDVTAAHRGVSTNFNDYTNGAPVVAHQIDLSAMELISPQENQWPFPLMGWESWTANGQGVTEAIVLGAANYLYTNGLSALGWNAVLIDEGWQTTSNGNIVVDSAKFPNGMKYVADYCHDRGLLLGLGQDLSGFSFSTKDNIVNLATNMAYWGIDEVKGIYSSDNNGEDSYRQQQIFIATLRSLSQRPVWFHVLTTDPTTLPVVERYATSIHANTLGINQPDTDGSFSNQMQHLDYVTYYSHRTKPGLYIDPDFLVIQGGSQTLTVDELKASMGLMAMLHTPIELSQLGYDFLTGSYLQGYNQTQDWIMSNPYLLSIARDTLARPADTTKTNGGAVYTYSKLLSDGSRAMAIVNRSNTAQTVSLDVSNVWVKGPVTVVDCFMSATDRFWTNSTSFTVPSHGIGLYKLIPGVVNPYQPGTNWLNQGWLSDSTNNTAQDVKFNVDSAAGGSGILTVLGTQYPKGIQVNAPAWAHFFAANQALNLTVSFGIDDVVAGTGSQPQVSLFIYTNNAIAYVSANKLTNQPVTTVSINMLGVYDVALYASNALPSENFPRLDIMAYLDVPNCAPFSGKVLGLSGFEDINLGYRTFGGYPDIYNSAGRLVFGSGIDGFQWNNRDDSVALARLYETGLLEVSNIIVSTTGGSSPIRIGYPGTGGGTADIYNSSGRLVFSSGVDGFQWNDRDDSLALMRLTETGTLTITGGSIQFNTIILTNGTGSPEGAVTAPVGSKYFRMDSTGNTYTKTNGTGNTGWFDDLLRTHG